MDLKDAAKEGRRKVVIRQQWIWVAAAVAALIVLLVVCR